MTRLDAALLTAALLFSTPLLAQTTGQPAQQAQPGTSAQQGGQQDQTTAGGGHEVSKPLVRQIQAHLKSQGYYDKTPDGQWDADTSNGLEGFQDAHGLQPTGMLDGMTILVLGVAPAGTGSGSTAPAGMTGGETAGGGTMGVAQEGRTGGGAIPRDMLVDIYHQGFLHGFEQGFRQSQMLTAISQQQGGQGSSQPSQNHQPSQNQQ